MAELNVKMGVSGVSQFIQSMNSAGASVKTIDAALKANEKELKATGDAATYMQQKSQLLNGKLKEQKKAIDDAQKALKTLKDNGTSEASKSFQDMQRKLLEAQSAMMDTEEQIRELGEASIESAAETDKLADSLGGLNKKVSLEQVTSAIHSITTGLENAAKKAISLSDTIFTAVMDKAKWADDAQTMALMYGIDLKTFLQMQKLVQNGLDTTVDAVLGAQSKMKKNVGSGSDSIMETLRELNLLQIQLGKDGDVEIIPEDSLQLFWDAGQAIMALTDEYEKENKAQQLFGKSWKELVPLFDEYKSLEEYKQALESTTTNTEEEVNVLAELNDKVGELKGNFDTLETKVMAGLAPALTKGADALSGLLEQLLAYLDTPEGQKALDDMAKAVEGLFTDLSNIDPDEIVKGFAGVFNGIVTGLQWLVNNSGTVISALEAIVIGWGALKLVGGALEIYKLIQGIMGLTGAGAASAAGAAGAAAGTSWGTAFANAVIAAAPWLIGLYTLLNPAETGNNDLVDKNGELTAEAWSDFLVQRQLFSNSGEKGYWSQLIEEAGEIVEASANLWDDVEGIKALSKYAQTGNKEQLAAELEALGYVLKTAAETVESVTVDDTGHMYDAAGNNVGYMMPKGEGEVIPHSVYKKSKVMPISPVTWFENGLEFRNVEGEELAELLGGENGAVDVPAEIVVEDGAAQIEEQVGTVPIPVELVVTDKNGNLLETFDVDPDGFNANGLWSVPFDGYHAVLHKGERVVPAREVAASRNFSSNLYVESMYMNNGTDADGLAAAMAAAQRRTMSGYGS